MERASAHLRALPDTDVCLSAGGDMVCHVADDTGPRLAGRHRGPARPDPVLVAVVGTTGRGRHLRHRPPGRAHHRRPDRRRAQPAVASVTVLADDLTWADIDATAAFALGPDAARWLRGRGHTGLVVHADGTTTVVEAPEPPR